MTVPAPQTRVWNLDNPADNTSGLIQLAQKWLTRQMVGVEVGSFSGASAEVLAAYAGYLHCVDPWDRCSDLGYSEIPRQMLVQAEVAFDARFRNTMNVCKIKAFSSEALHRFTERSLDFVYIDGAHDKRNAAFDILAWSRKVKSEGLLMGHDLYLVRDVLEFLEIPVIESFPDTSWVAQAI